MASGLLSHGFFKHHHDEVCKTCGKRFGSHVGMNCDNRHGKFELAGYRRNLSGGVYAASAPAAESLPERPETYHGWLARYCEETGREPTIREAYEAGVRKRTEDTQHG